MKYGLMPESDYVTIDKTLVLVNEAFKEGVITTFEIGVHKGNTSRGIRDFFKNKGRINFHTGVDNQQDFKMDAPFEECHFLIGESDMMSTEIRDNSQHFGFIDANHSFRYTVSDFLLYKDKIVPGGFLAFHDTGAQIKIFKDYQQVGSRENPYNYICCREAVSRLGLLDNKFHGWEKVYDEWDKNYDTGGVFVIRKLK